MTKPKQEAMLDPLIIEEIKRREEEEKKRRDKQPQIPLEIPEHDPAEEERWKKEKEREKEPDPRGIEKIDLL